jgi:pimeloyl-ACP methyl ester carboxylesterase
MSQVEVEGLSIAFERAGRGPGLVLLHGAVCDRRVWRAQIDAFADAYTVVAWDAPGCGESSDPPESFRMPQFAACLAALIDELGLEQPHVLGQSWGTSLAFELYRLRPELARSLTLVGAYAGWAGSLTADEVSRRLAFALATAALEPGEFEPTTMPGVFSDVMPARQAEELAAIMREVRPAGTRTMARALAEADQRPMLSTIAVPTLLVYGERDERSPIAVGEALERAIPTATLERLPGLGHECFLEAPSRFNAVVRAFLDSFPA